MIFLILVTSAAFMFVIYLAMTLLLDTKYLKSTIDKLISLLWICIIWLILSKLFYISYQHLYITTKEIDLHKISYQITIIQD